MLYIETIFISLLVVSKVPNAEVVVHKILV